MSDLAKMEWPNFIKTTIVATNRGGKGFSKLNVRISPMAISSYVEDVIVSEDGEKAEVVRMYVGGMQYCVDMTLAEVDEMMENIDRGVSIKE